jgi:tartrate-resistant acid phosphatase type 5
MKVVQTSAWRMLVIALVLLTAVVFGSVSLLDGLKTIPSSVAAGYQGGVVEASFPEGVEDLVLLFLGDTGSGNANQSQVAQRLERACQDLNPAAVILVGDNFYNDGVAGVEDTQWQGKFEHMYNTPCLAALPFYAVLGNHDVRDNPAAQIAYTGLGSGRWHMPARSYSVAFGDWVKIAMIDSNFPDYCGGFPCTLDRVAKEMSERQAHWTLAVGHHPLYSGGKYPRPAFFRAFFLERFYCSLAADGYVSGHEHNLQSLVVTRGHPQRPRCDVHQIISGAGGANLYPTSSIPNTTRFAASVHGFASARFSQDTLTWSFWSVDQETPLHEEVVERSP